MDFVKKGMIASKYLADGCEFKKQKDSYKLISTGNIKFEPFLGKTFSPSTWDMIAGSDITSGEKHDKLTALLIDHFKSGQTIFNSQSNLLLKKDERIIFQSYNTIILKEPKSIRVTNSVHVGSSRRRGNRAFGVGNSTSRGESHEEIKVIDSGQITITNKRFIFTGSKRTIDVNISQITGITPYSDAIVLQRKSKQKPEYFLNIDSFIFTYKFNDESYFFVMNGNFIKSMVEGGLNKKPQVSKLQQYNSKLLEEKIGLIPFSYENISLKYNSSWRKVQNQKSNHIISLERIADNFKCQMYIYYQDIPKDYDKFILDVKAILNKPEFESYEFNEIKVNGIDMLSVPFIKKVGGQQVEGIFTFFNNGIKQFCVFSYFKIGSDAKKDYDDLLKTIRINNNKTIGDKPKFCPDCGEKINLNGNFCSNCGFDLRKLNIR